MMSPHESTPKLPEISRNNNTIVSTKNSDDDVTVQSGNSGFGCSKSKRTPSVVLEFVVKLEFTSSKAILPSKVATNAMSILDTVQSVSSGRIQIFNNNAQVLSDFSVPTATIVGTGAAGGRVADNDHGLINSECSYKISN
ncbi:MAG: hypothetical protein SGILL_007673 [Bacillariaceae sp.]